MCTGVRFTDNKGNMFFGRNLDWSVGYGQKIVVTPKGYKYHSAFLGDLQPKYALIGMGSTLLDGAHVGEGAIVAAGALVLKNTQIGPYELWGGVPAKFIKKVEPAQTAEINQKIAHNYAMYASWYKD